MRASELMVKLNELINIYGDLPVVVMDGDEQSDVDNLVLGEDEHGEFVDFLIADRETVLAFAE